ncbi:MAG: metal ABC transporter permease [Verrucomicrobia bacterium]|nr:metal ABC transporter permease [Verrucomicrobiota bacterium]
MWSFLTDNPNLWYVMGGCAILGVASGALGCFAVLRRQSLLGDALAHAALPGICLAFLLTGSKSPGVMLVGALASSLLGALFILGIVRGTRLKEDSAIGIVLSVFFGGGIVLLTAIQHRPTAAQAGLDKFLFGYAASLVPRDLEVLGMLTLAVLAVLALFYKEFKLLAFDREFGAAMGFPMRTLEVLLTALVVVAVVIGLQTVGVVLMAAMLITPAVAARQWTHSLGLMVTLAALIGAGCGVTGAVLSGAGRNIPTGPVIVLAVTLVMLFSIAMAPRRGLVWSWVRLWRHRKKVRLENLLADFYRLGEPQQDWKRARTLPALAIVRGQPPARVARTVAQLERSGLLASENGQWRLTDTGLEQARRILRNHRLWEMFLSRRLELAADHIHRDAEEMEHALSPAIVAELERLLGQPAMDPHHKPIPVVNPKSEASNPQSS